MAWYTGARLNALRGLNFEHYHSGDQYVEFLHKPDRGIPLKNSRGGERAVGIPHHVVDMVNRYVRKKRVEQHTNDGARQLFTSSVGRPGENTFCSYMYHATQPCLHSPGPHGNERETCDYLTQETASRDPVVGRRIRYGPARSPGN